MAPRALAPGRPGGKAADVTQDQVADELLRLLERAGVDPADIAPDTPLAALYLDSVDHAEIREALHERFGIEVDPSELATTHTVGDAQRLILAKVKAVG